MYSYMVAYRYHTDFRMIGFTDNMRSSIAMLVMHLQRYIKSDQRENGEFVTTVDPIMPKGIFFIQKFPIGVDLTVGNVSPPEVVLAVPYADDVLKGYLEQRKYDAWSTLTNIIVSEYYFE